MLRFCKVSSPSDIEVITKDYDPLQHTWLVSDLKSKQEIQNLAISKHGYFTDDAIMRVSDFWRLWMRRLEPTLHVVSSDFIQILVQNFVEKHGPKLDLLTSEVSTLTRALQEFAPLLIHPQSRELISEWLAEDFKVHQKNKKWQRWYQLSQLCLNTILSENQVIDAKWSAAYLQSADLGFFKWPRPIFVELGSELTSVEMGLFKILSQHQDVTIITPTPEWSAKFPFLLKVYETNFGYGQVLPAKSLTNLAALKPDQFKRMSTQLGEIKMAVNQCRIWADAGVALPQIAIIAADIENYWPVLQMHLDAEGLSYQKDTVAQLNSLGDVQNLIAKLKSMSEEVSWESLEKSIFNKETKTDYNFEKFKALFYQLYDQDDLNRDRKIKELYFKKLEFHSELSRDEFLSLLVKIWVSLPASQMKEPLFEVIFKDLLAQSIDISLKLSKWLDFFKNRISRKEMTITKAQAHGLQVLPLMSAQMSSLTNKIYLGLNDEFFKINKNKLMNSTDAKKINDDLGLSLDVSEESALDFNLRWQSSQAECIYTSAHLSFNADPLNASLYFIENLPQSEILSPPKTRFDELQTQFQLQPEDFSVYATASYKRVEQDMNGSMIQTRAANFETLSVADIENYAQCSFKLLAAKGFKLRDDAQVSIDLDPRDRGQLVHSLFEFLIQKLQTNTVLIESIDQYLESERQSRKLYLHQDAIWQVQKNKFIKLGLRFIEFEKDRISLFTTEVEKSINVFFDLDKKCFSAEKPDKFFQFKLRLDRVDTHKKNKYSIVYDYKSTAFSVEKAAKWLSEYQFQMLLYLMALKLTLPTDIQIKGSLYYYYKNFEIKDGLIDERIGLEDFLFSKRNASLYTEETRLVFDQEFTLIISEILERLQTGLFEAKPFKTSICTDCDWRQLCRAVHLN